MEISEGFDIASYSMANASARVLSDVSIAVLDKTMELQQTSGEQLAKMMELSVTPSLGGNVDIRI